MSEYGRLYEAASRIRRRLEEALPGLLVGNYTPADAKRIVREEMTRRVSGVDQLADEWARFEEIMRETND